VAAAPRPRFTNRAAILLVVFAILVISYASSMRAYLQQRDHINELKQQIASSKASIADAEREKRRWRDPAYVEAQARERFGWVLPGETSYQVLDANGNPLTGEDELTDPDSIAPSKPKAWWTKAYSTLEAADHPEKKVTPTPATRITPDQ
jgi:cell division protein FtsB